MVVPAIWRCKAETARLPPRLFAKERQRAAARALPRFPNTSLPASLLPTSNFKLRSHLRRTRFPCLFFALQPLLAQRVVTNLRNINLHLCKRRPGIRNQVPKRSASPRLRVSPIARPLSPPPYFPGPYSPPRIVPRKWLHRFSGVRRGQRISPQASTMQEVVFNGQVEVACLIENRKKDESS